MLDDLGGPEDSVDWEEYERQVERELKRQEPGACHHYFYPVGINGIRSVVRDGQVVNICVDCLDPF